MSKGVVREGLWHARPGAQVSVTRSSEGGARTQSRVGRRRCEVHPSMADHATRSSGGGGGRGGQAGRGGPSNGQGRGGAQPVHEHRHDRREVLPHVPNTSNATQKQSPITLLARAQLERCPVGLLPSMVHRTPKSTMDHDASKTLEGSSKSSGRTAHSIQMSNGLALAQLRHAFHATGQPIQSSCSCWCCMRIMA